MSQPDDTYDDVFAYIGVIVSLIFIFALAVSLLCIATDLANGEPFVTMINAVKAQWVAQ